MQSPLLISDSNCTVDLSPWTLTPSANLQLNMLKSLFLERCGCDFKWVNFKHNLGIGILSISINITLEWIPENLVDPKSIWGQVMAWCRQATNHYLNQCWLRSLMPYVFIWPHWVNGNWFIRSPSVVKPPQAYNAYFTCMARLCDGHYYYCI